VVFNTNILAYFDSNLSAGLGILAIFFGFLNKAGVSSVK